MNKKDEPVGGARYRRAFWGAVAITLVLWLIPFGGLAIYPFSLLATWAHEMGHGLMALVAGGRFVELEVHVGLSGLAQTATAGAGAKALVSAGGLIGAPLLGAAVIVLGSRPRGPRPVLAALGAALVASVVLWVRNPFGVVACLGLAAGMGAAAWRLSPSRRMMLTQLVGIQLALSALRNWRYLFVGEAVIGGRVMPSDVAAIARVLGGPYWFWGLLLTGFNLGLLYVAYRWSRWRLDRA